MDGKGIRRQSLYLLQGAPHIIHILLGKPHNQIHVDIVKSQLPGHVKTLLHHLHGVVAPNEVQGFLVHSLGINGNTGNAVVSKHLKLVRGNAVRPSGLHCKLQHAAQVKELLQPA